MSEAIYEAHITYQAEIGVLDMSDAEKERLEKDRWNTIVRKIGVKIRLITIKEVKDVQGTGGIGESCRGFRKGKEIGLTTTSPERYDCL